MPGVVCAKPKFVPATVLYALRYTPPRGSSALSIPSTNATSLALYTLYYYGTFETGDGTVSSNRNRHDIYDCIDRKRSAYTVYIEQGGVETKNVCEKTKIRPTGITARFYFVADDHIEDVV